MCIILCRTSYSTFRRFAVAISVSFLYSRVRLGEQSFFGGNLYLYDYLFTVWYSTVVCEGTNTS